MKSLRFAVLSLGVFLVACGAPCEERNGSVDGYCDGNVAVNCLSTCADCIDQWIETPCSGTCGVGDDLPPEADAGGGMPHMSEPTAYASCSEWSEDDTGGN